MALTDKQKQIIDEILSNPNLTDLKKEQIFGNILKGSKENLLVKMKSAAFIFMDLDVVTSNIIFHQEEIDRTRDLYDDLNTYPPLLALARKNNDMVQSDYIKELKKTMDDLRKEVMDPIRG